MTSKFSFASGNQTDYIESMYQDWKKDPSGVDESWAKFFEGFDFGRGEGIGFQDEQAQNHAKVEAFVNAYRRLGHLTAHLNPLDDKPENLADMSREYHGLGSIDGSEKFHPANFGDQAMTLDDIEARLVKTYSSTIGADFRDINNIEIVTWLQQKMESVQNKPKLSNELRMFVYDNLVRAEGFEKFLHKRYLGQKRFSLEGLEALIPMMHVLADQASVHKGEEICVGMAHRGRLNVLANFMGKPYDHMLSEFEGSEFNPFDIDGDVKYHLGFANELETFSNNKMRVYLAANPSHLEAVNPVVEGFVRSRQRQEKDTEREKIIPVLLHGDAAFIGQGLVAETLNLSKLESYDTGGTVHIITNNQVGFTTNPSDSRSCVYASDIAKLVRAPVFHVNADDIDACVWVAQLAMEFRQTFKRDVVIDLIGYRRHGHNEGDEPSFTQPLMYKKIKKHPSSLTQYQKTLESENVRPASELKKAVSDFSDTMQEAYEAIKTKRPKLTTIQFPDKLARTMNHKKVSRSQIFKHVSTKVTKQKLAKVLSSLTTYPKGFKPHPKAKRVMEQRKAMLEGEGRFDWATAELLAFGTLALDGHHVRLSGQDCKRGTFTSRHSVFFDVETGNEYESLNHIEGQKDSVDIINSPLSEQGCLGFEFGYSIADENSLLLWEAQFGDFANGAQIIVDQFIVASEAKWKQSSGLTLLLPHGYEGQGPEHSNARPERFLQLCGNLNVQVTNVTTPAQHFHLLRRQMKRPFRKPLICMTPKSLLRHEEVLSSTEDFTSGEFLEVLDDTSIQDKSGVDRLVLCTGKIYYEAKKRALELGTKDKVALVRVEQLYPFPAEAVGKVLSDYAHVHNVVWVQEEPQNMGAWSFIRPRLEELLGDEQGLAYVGRRYSGTTAEGSGKAHAAEQARIIDEAFGIVCAWEPKLVHSK